MTVSSVVVRAVAVWTGVETEFPTGIQVLEKSQLAVSLVSGQGQHQVLTLGLHYSVALSPAGIATVFPLGAFPVTPGTVSFVRQTPMTQTYDPTTTDTYDAAGHAAALDRSAMRVAELSQKVDDIGASSIVVAGAAASVPEGAVYVSNGEGGAVAGPTAAEIETARAAAVSAAGTATGAAGVATGAATAAGSAAALADELANAAPDTPVGTGFSARHWAAVAQALSEAFDLDSYSTTEQIAAMLKSFVPAARKLKVGPGLSLDGAAGSDAELATTDLSADRLIRLLFATPVEAAAGLAVGLPVDPAGVAAEIASLSIRRGNAVATTGGTAFDFTGIPSTAKRVTVQFKNVSTAGSSLLIVQLGAGSIQTTGYNHTGVLLNSAGGSAGAGSPPGFPVFQSIGAADVSGFLAFENINGNQWITSGVLRVLSDSVALVGGDVTLAGVLYRVRITTANGTDAFDAGTVNISWE